MARFRRTERPSRPRRRGERARVSSGTSRRRTRAALRQRRPRGLLSRPKAAPLTPARQRRPRCVRANCAPPVRSFLLFSLRAHRQRQPSAPVASIGSAGSCEVFTFLPRPSDLLHRKQPQRSAPAHRTPRGSRQRAGIAARGLALPWQQQRDEVVDKWRQAQQSRPARHQRAGNWFNATTRQMQLSAVQKLLPAPEMARGMQHIAECEVQGRLLAEMGQCGGQILV